MRSMNVTYLLTTCGGSLTTLLLHFKSATPQVAGIGLLALLRALARRVELALLAQREVHVVFINQHLRYRILIDCLQETAVAYTERGVGTEVAHLLVWEEEEGEAHEPSELQEDIKCVARLEAALVGDSVAAAILLLGLA